MTVAATDAEIDRAFDVVAELRPHLRRGRFVAQVRRQEAQGYRLACLVDRNAVRAVAGFRLLECLAWGRALYVDDLVTREADRSRGYGRTLFAWLVDFARRSGCDELHLDSGVHRFAAHRFYLLQRMEISSHHFSRKLR